MKINPRQRHPDAPPVTDCSEQTITGPEGETWHRVDGNWCITVRGGYYIADSDISWLLDRIEADAVKMRKRGSARVTVGDYRRATTEDESVTVKITDHEQGQPRNIFETASIRDERSMSEQTTDEHARGLRYVAQYIPTPSDITLTPLDRDKLLAAADRIEALTGTIAELRKVLEKIANTTSATSGRRRRWAQTALAAGETPDG
ncbi:MAG: hypothetical protein V3U14_13000 [candidate division NC10 bacterium]